MNVGKRGGKQAVAGHRKPHPRLPKLKHENRGDHAHQRAGGNPAVHAIQPDRLERLRNRRRGVELAPVLNAGENERHRDVEE